MTLTVLTDAQISSMLEALTLEEAEGFRKAMERALHEYSNGINLGVERAGSSTADGGEDEGGASLGQRGGRGEGTRNDKAGVVSMMPTHQPPRTSSISPGTGATSLFMPSTNSLGVGVKVVTLMAPSAPGTGAAKTATSSSSSTSGSASAANKLSTRPTGAITLFSPSGEAHGLLHARTLTAFRTALASTTLLVRRSSVKSIVVFGAGEQAYWHVRLALLFRGSGIRDVTIVNPRASSSSYSSGDNNSSSSSNGSSGSGKGTKSGGKGSSSSLCSCEALISRFVSIPHATKTHESWTTVKFSLLRRSDHDHDPDYFNTLLTQKLRKARVIITATPSTIPLFPAEILTNHAGRKKGRLVVAIGSYQPHMLELPSGLLLQATKRKRGGGRGGDEKKTRRRRFGHRHAVEGGVVVVDSVDGAMEEAGEIREAGLDPGRLVELGELLMLSKGVVGCAPTTSASSGAFSPGRGGGSRTRSTSSEAGTTGTRSSSTTVGGDDDDARTHCSECSSRRDVHDDGYEEDEEEEEEEEGEGERETRKRRAGQKKDGSRRQKISFWRKGLTKGSSLLSSKEKGDEHHGKEKVEVGEGEIEAEREREVEEREEDAEMATWLREGNVVYKSVGVGVMDLAIGMHIVEFAKAKGVGTHVEGF